MENRIRGKRALITGASAGIGKACAERLAAAGVHLLLAARRFDRIWELQVQLTKDHPVQVDIFTLDVRDRKAVKEFVSGLTARSLLPDILINNAGLAAGLNSLHEGDFDDWDRMIDTNVKGLLNVSRYLIPLMIGAGRGHIVNVGSIAGYQVYPKGNVYNATKFAVRALSEGMNIDLAGTGIRVSMISPGAVNTEFSEVRFHGDREAAAKVYEGYTPLTAADIAAAIYFIVNAPPHVNVQNIVITPTAQRNVYCVDRRQ
ncbi:MAG TPA: SDR family NAD(P)-dependent oxidoreductase [Syntrophales bacterium]|mgnify:CR=1 FL=1|nr:SDR family NAD(P)-dependent oxidoreductase [Syntrophales bacterium]